MKDVVVADRLAGIEVEPALAALVLRPAVPGDPERLKTPVGKLDQILLQRKDAERVFDLEFGELAVGTVCLDHELAVATEKARLDAEMLEGCIREIAEHRLVRRVVHRALMVRAGPEFGFVLMAGGAGLAADIGQRRRIGGAGSKRASGA